jgi:hypothetical protein
LLADSDRGLCATLADVDLGCDDAGVVGSDDDPSTVRWGLDDGRWLAFGYLPDDAVDVVIVRRPGVANGDPGKPVVDRDSGLWAVGGMDRLDQEDVGAGYVVRYRLADGTLIDAPTRH